MRRKSRGSQIRTSDFCINPIQRTYITKPNYEIYFSQTEETGLGDFGGGGGAEDFVIDFAESVPPQQILGPLHMQPQIRQ